MLRILAADMGGTTCRFGFFEAEGGDMRLLEIIRLETRAFDSFASLLDGLFASSSPVPSFGPRACDACVLAVPGAVIAGAYCKPPNIPWDIDLAEAVRRGLSRALLINDFAAQAWACRSEAGQNALILQAGVPDPEGVVAVIGAGTGLGHCALAKLPGAEGDGGGFLTLPSEAGHAAFPFVGKEESAFGEFLRQRTGAPYCVGDSVVTGSGLAHLFEYLTGESVTPPRAASRLGEYPQVTEWFARFYGRAARNYALSVLARGGLFVSGGVAGRNPALVDHPAFLEEFRSSRGHGELLAAMPVAHMRDQDAGVHGAALAALHLLGGET